MQAGDAWQPEERLKDDASIPRINRCMYQVFEPAYGQQMQATQGLGAWWKQLAREKLQGREGHWTETMAQD